MAYIVLQVSLQPVASFRADLFSPFRYWDTVFKLTQVPPSKPYILVFNFHDPLSDPLHRPHFDVVYGHNIIKFCVPCTDCRPNSMIVILYFVLSSHVTSSIICLSMGGRNSVVNRATRNGLDGPVIACRCVRSFSHPSRQALEPTQPPV